MFKRGLYRHYKGGLYHLMCIARHTETAEPVAVYVNLTGPRERGWSCRPMRGPGGFDEFVVWPDGLSRPRFTAEDKL